MFAARLAFVSFLAIDPLAAQDYAPDFARIEALVVRLESGDSSAMPQLEREGRGLFTWSAQRRVTGSTAHLVARVGMAAGAPFAHADSAITQHEVFWRGGLVRALHSALAADSGDIIAAEILERLEPYPHLWMEPHRQLMHLRALLARHGTLPTALGVAYVGLELERGDPELAQLMLRVLDRNAVGQVRWSHLDAQAHFARHASYGENRYFDGASAIRSAADAAPYRADLEWIAEPHELAEWDALQFGDSVHTVWLRKFWTRRDLEDARMPGTRLREHFARWRLALKEYRWDREAAHAKGVSSGTTWARSAATGDILFPFPVFNAQAEPVYYNRLRSRSRVLDDRGATVMRHGPPTWESIQHGLTGLDQATLQWHTASGPLLIGFSRPAIPFGGPQLEFGMIARNIPMGDLMAICPRDARLCSLAALATLPGGERDHAIELARNRYQSMRETAESTDENPQHFATPLETYVQAYSISGGGVLVSYAIRARDLQGGPARLRIVTGSLAEGRVVAALDTLRRWTDTTTPETFVTGWSVVDAPPGTWRVGVVLSDSIRERGSGSTFDNVAVTGSNCPTPCFSDPILGREASGLRWTYKGRRIPLNPTGAWLRSEEGVLSAELYGLVPNRDYRVSIELLEGTGEDARSRLVITESLTPTDTTHFLQRNISFANLERGEYRLVLRVTDPLSGSAVQRERLVPVR